MSKTNKSNQHFKVKASHYDEKQTFLLGILNARRLYNGAPEQPISCKYDYTEFLCYTKFNDFTRVSRNFYKAQPTLIGLCKAQLTDIGHFRV